MLKNKKIEFVGSLKKCLIISLALILVGIIVTAILGPVLDITFSGGTRITYSYTGKVDTAKVAQLAADTIGKKVNVNTTSGVSDNSQKLVISLAENKSLDTTLIDKLTAKFEKDSDYADNKIKQESVNSVNASVGAVFFAKCLVAVLIAAVLVIIYVTIRFRKIGGLLAGSAAMVALIHDIIIAFLASCVFRLPIDSNFIAVVMILLGYSLNSTIVVFDRVRENRRIHGSKLTLSELVNLSNNQVISRNIMTNLSTLVAVIVIIIVCELNGITALRSLSVPLAFGLLSGAYTSIFLSPSIWVRWKDKVNARKKAKK